MWAAFVLYKRNRKRSYKPEETIYWSMGKCKELILPIPYHNFYLYTKSFKAIACGVVLQHKPLNGAVPCY